MFKKRASKLINIYNIQNQRIYLKPTQKNKLHY